MDNSDGHIIIREDELYYVFRKLRHSDLVKCRLVSQLWWRVSTNVLRMKSGPVLLHNECQIQNFRMFTEWRPLSLPLPFNSYDLNFRTNCSKCSTAVYKILLFIKQQTPCHLTIHHCCYFEKSYDRNGHVIRRAALNFLELLSVKFMIMFDRNFRPVQVNMAEVCEHNPSLDTISLVLQGAIPRHQQRELAALALQALCSRNFAKLSKLQLHLDYVENCHLHALKGWCPPLRVLEVGNLSPSVDSNSADPSSLISFLRNIATTLQVLQLQIKPFNDNDTKAEIFDIRFPEMTALLKLSFVSTEDINCFDSWHLMSNRFTFELPNLLELRFSGFHYLEAAYQHCTFLPNPKFPSSTVRVLELPHGSEGCEPKIMRMMLLMFPHVTQFEMICSNAMSVAILIGSLPRLQKLTLHFGEDTNALDGILLGHSAGSGQQFTVMESCGKKDVNSETSITRLQNLEELSLTTYDHYVHISDATALSTFLRMPKFKRLICHAPQTTQWMLSVACMEKLANNIDIIMIVDPPIREKDDYGW